MERDGRRLRKIERARDSDSTPCTTALYCVKRYSYPLLTHFCYSFLFFSSSALKTKHDTPKYGLLYHASVVGQSQPKNKGKMSRVLAAKTSLVVRRQARTEQQMHEPTGRHRACERLRDSERERLRESERERERERESERDGRANWSQTWTQQRQ